MGSDAPVIKLVTEPSTYLKCPQCKSIYIDPVINVPCGHTFCRKCAFTITKCPVDGSHCDTNQLVVNRTLLCQVEDLEIYCRYGLLEQDGEYTLDPEGCQEKILLGKRQEHEDQCSFGQTPCPNSAACGTFRKETLALHLSLCKFNRCTYHGKGCQYEGTQSQVEIHSRSCLYRGASLYHSNHVDQIATLTAANGSLREEVVQLTNRVHELETSQSALLTQVSTYQNGMQLLQLQVEKLNACVEQLLASQPRRSLSSSQMNMSETGHRRSHSFTSTQSSPTNHKFEHWEMPFQFKCIGTFKGHADVVWSLAVYKGRLFSAGADHCIKVWDLEKLAKGCISSMQGHVGVVHCLCCCNGYLYSGGDDHSIRKWDMEAEKEVLAQMEAHDNIICAMAGTGDFLFTSSFSVIKVWEAKTLQLKHTMPGLFHWVRALVIGPNKDKLYSGSHNEIHIWDTTGSFQLVSKIDHQFGSVYSLAVTTAYIIAGNSGTYNQNIQIFNANTHEHVTNLVGHVGTVTALIPSLSGRFLFSASHDSQIQVWSLEKILPIQTLSRHEGSVNTLAVYNNLLLSGSVDREIKVFRYFHME